VWVVLEMKVHLGEGDRNMRPLGLDLGMLDTHMLHPSLGIFLLLLVDGFEARASSDGEHKLSHPSFGAPRPGHEHNHQVCWDQLSHL
jgi:hypothetical protein